MTAPASPPDLEALQNTADAMRLAGVSGVTISVDEADALIAAAREREALKADAEQGIHPAEREVTRLREALVGIRQAIHHPLMRADISDAARAAITEQIDAALAEGRDG